MLLDLLRFWWKPTMGKAMVVLIHAGNHLDRFHRHEAREYLYELNEEKREESLTMRLHGVMGSLTGKSGSHYPFVVKCRELFQEAADRIEELEKGEENAT